MYTQTVAVDWLDGWLSRFVTFFDSLSTIEKPLVKLEKKVLRLTWKLVRYIVNSQNTWVVRMQKKLPNWSSGIWRYNQNTLPVPHTLQNRPQFCRAHIINQSILSTWLKGQVKFLVIGILFVATVAMELDNFRRLLQNLFQSLSRRGFKSNIDVLVAFSKYVDYVLFCFAESQICIV